jgi:tetratricopeptide (TPR) repeat protein
VLDQLLVRWPADLLALLIGHQLDFFLGDAANLRDRVGRSSAAVPTDHPHRGFVLGMLAFGLEETGSYERAEDVGLAALERNSDDVWAIHAVVHTYEMRGRVDQGIRFLRSREDDWTHDNLFTVHNWWHQALFLLEAGEPDAALRIYDARLHHDGSDGVPLEMLDASALLWRLHLDGIDTGGRCGPLAEAWSGRMGEAPWYVFNDVHAVMAFVGAGRLADARAVTQRLARHLVSGGRGTNRFMTREVGLPACRALVAFGEGRHDDVVELLLPIRATLNRFGGSHAQRDALQRTVLESALRAKRRDLARALLNERLTVRYNSVYAWSQQARLARAEGDERRARASEAEAARHRDLFAVSR